MAAGIPVHDSLPMNKIVERAGLQTKSASQLPLRGNSGLAGQRKFFPP
jgi:hypothetical protein